MMRSHFPRRHKLPLEPIREDTGHGRVHFARILFKTNKPSLSIKNHPSVPSEFFLPFDDIKPIKRTCQRSEFCGFCCRGNSFFGHVESAKMFKFRFCARLCWSGYNVGAGRSRRCSRRGRAGHAFRRGCGGGITRPSWACKCHAPWLIPPSNGCL
jgi:hypothetical protein